MTSQASGMFVNGSPPASGPDATVRDRLLAAALTLFTTKGYAATTVREIVEKAGVTKPVLYYYFRNKEGIYLELMGAAFGEFETLVGSVLAGGGSARRRIVDLSVRTYEIACEHIGVTRLMYAIYYGPPQGAPFFDFEAVHRRVRDVIHGLVLEGISAGEFRNERPEDITFAVIGILNVAIEIELCHPEMRLMRDGVERVLDLILDGLAVRRTGGVAE